MPLPFASSPTCKLCDLHETCVSVGVPTRPAYSSDNPEPTHKRALLVIGEAPGYHEDMEGRAFIGRSGYYLDRLYLDAFGFKDLVDIYLTNTVRCRPPGNRTPTPRQAKLCRTHLLDDLKRLSNHYEEVIILCVGAVALRTITRQSLAMGFKAQGQVQEISGNRHRVFATYHPAMLTKKRAPSAIVYVKEHLRLLWDYMTNSGTFDSRQLPNFPYTVATEPPVERLERVALDIETYGILEDYEQRYFHPRKSEHWDHIPKDQLIVTVALSYCLFPLIPSKSEEVTNVVFEWPRDLPVLTRWLRKLKAEGTPLVLMNAQFDLLYLRYAAPQLRPILDDPMIIMDLAVRNFHYGEDRPERSLKNIAPLHGLPAYQVSAKTHRFPRESLSQHPNALCTYNAQDSATTLLLDYDLERRIRQKYGEGTAKLSAYSRLWYSRLVWCCIWMAEAGVSFDVEKLEGLHDRVKERTAKLKEIAVAHYNAPLAGKGSRDATEKLLDAAVLEAGIQSHPNLTLTAVTQKISTSEVNINLALQHLPVRHPIARRLRMLMRFRWYQKLQGTYLQSRLEGRRKDKLNKSHTHINGVVYPSWFAVPSEFKDDAEGAESGGTNQCRITCKEPALQTDPKELRVRMTTRFNPGYRLHADYSQLELRMAALLSGDRRMMQEYEDPKLDRHLLAAVQMFGEQVHTLPEARREQLRQFGKRRNFLILFRGSGEKLRQTGLLDLGLELSLEDCNRYIDESYALYPELGAWQETLIRKAKMEGWLEVPLVGASRQFHGSSSVIDATYIPTIVNVIVQAGAACVMQSAQYAIARNLLDRKLRSKIVMNCHDAIDLEGPLCELSLVRPLVREGMEDAPYMRDLFAYYGRRVMFKTSINVVERYPTWGIISRAS